MKNTGTLKAAAQVAEFSIARNIRIDNIEYISATRTMLSSHRRDQAGQVASVATLVGVRVRVRVRVKVRVQVRVQVRVRVRVRVSRVRVSRVRVTLPRA